MADFPCRTYSDMASAIESLPPHCPRMWLGDSPSGEAVGDAERELEAGRTLRVLGLSVHREALDTPGLRAHERASFEPVTASCAEKGPSAAASAIERCELHLEEHPESLAAAGDDGSDPGAGECGLAGVGVAPGEARAVDAFAEDAQAEYEEAEEAEDEKGPATSAFASHVALRRAEGWKKKRRQCA